MTVIRKPKSVEEFINAGPAGVVVETITETPSQKHSEPNTNNSTNSSETSETTNSAKTLTSSQEFSQESANNPESNNQESIQPVKLRLPQILLQQIDEIVAKRKPAPSRHQWILEAIYDKLGRE